MGKIYKGQSKLLINVNLGVDVTDANVKLKYRKPNNDEGSFNTTILSASAGDVQVEITSADELDTVGTWVLWSFITYQDGKVAYGEPFEIIINKEGK